MSESEEAVAPPQPPPPPPEQDLPPPLQIEAPPEEPNPDTVFCLWPPTTRDAIVSRLMETLSALSALSARYGTLPRDEAAPVARAIEQEEYAAAATAPASADDDGVDVLQAYARAMAQRMLDSLEPCTARDHSSFPPKTPEVLDFSPSFYSGVERSSSF